MFYFRLAVLPIISRIFFKIAASELQFIHNSICIIAGLLTFSLIATYIQGTVVADKNCAKIHYISKNI